MSSIKVGSYGWQSASLLQSFYPPDLPEDWRLSFYANEFSSVLVPADVWCAAELDIEEWQDVPEHFSFYLQQADEACSERLAEIGQALGEKLGDCVSVGTELPLIEKGVAIIDSQQLSLREWRYWLEQNADTLNVIFLKDANISYQNLHDFKSLLELMGY